MLQLARGGDTDQFSGDLTHPRLGLRLALLPAAAAETIEHGAFVGAVTGKKLDVLDRQKQLAAVVLQFQAIVRRTGDFDGLETEIAADAVLDVGHQIAGRQRRRLGQEILRLAHAGVRPRHAVAEDVLFGNDDEIRGFETVLQSQHRQTGGASIHLLRIRPIGDRTDGRQSMIGQNRAQSFGRAFGPGGEQHAFLCRD